MPRILLTGGTGYIGSHTAVELIGAGYETVLFDNLCNSSPVVVDRIAKITGTRPAFVEGDIRERSALGRVFETCAIDAVIHFAGLKAVGESVAHPVDYYANNVGGTAALLQAMDAHDVRRIVFSSSATVYDATAPMPLTEASLVGPSNPYGHSKRMVEQMLADLAHADPRWHALALRYFNPVGAHESGQIGEDPRGTPNNLMPFVAQVAAGRLPRLRVFGDDYPTPDGTGVRDYVHVVDLASGHVAALARLLGTATFEHPAINLGTGRGASVLEVVRAFEAASGKPVPYEIAPRRPGDGATCWADPGLAERAIGWKAERALDAMCRDAWRWQEANPLGYAR